MKTLFPILLLTLCLLSGNAQAEVIGSLAGDFAAPIDHQTKAAMKSWLYENDQKTATQTGTWEFYSLNESSDEYRLMDSKKWLSPKQGGGACYSDADHANYGGATLLFFADYANTDKKTVKYTVDNANYKRTGADYLFNHPNTGYASVIRWTPSADYNCFGSDNRVTFTGEFLGGSEDGNLLDFSIYGVDAEGKRAFLLHQSISSSAYTIGATVDKYEHYEFIISSYDDISYDSNALKLNVLKNATGFQYYPPRSRKFPIRLPAGTEESDFVVCDSESIATMTNVKTGTTVLIQNPKDKAMMNWIDAKSHWGITEDFEVQSVEKKEDGTIVVSCLRDGLRLTVEKFVEKDRYVERYRVTNEGTAEFSLTRDNFGIPFPYNCNFAPRPRLLETSCVTHIWCGGDASWLYSAKLDGSRPYLVCWVDGSLSDYSIDYDGSKTRNGSYYRGAPIVHPTDAAIRPQESKTWTFTFSFTDRRPDEFFTADAQAMRVSADSYSPLTGETVHGTLETAFPWETAEIQVDGTNISYEKSGNSARWSHVFTTPGEREIQVTAGGKKTFLRVNVLEPIDTILARRARFIVEKQQFHGEGNPLDGAYLIYDRTTQKTYYDAVFRDNNASRERISMGVIVAVELQKRPNPELLESLKKHRAFVERELFDEKTMTVFDGVGRDNRWRRAYNYPWMSDYYLEWYKLTGERKCLENAAGILLKHYQMIDGVTQESPCIEAAEIDRCLGLEKMDSLRAEVRAAVLKHADLTLRQGVGMYSGEVSYSQGIFALKITGLCNAYQFSNDPKYLAPIDSFLNNLDAYSGNQPDFHVNHLGVSYWDLYWFGKSRTYGDTMPQWVTSLSGQTFATLAEIGQGGAFTAKANHVLRNNLCVYTPDGFGSAGYLVPYRVRQFYPPNVPPKGHIAPGTAYGKRYDDWANDQDWALYYAVRYAK